MKRSLNLVVLVLALSLFVHAARAAFSGDGIYAGFVTSGGEFWCKLEFERAPRTTANFLSLAEGTRPWIDMKTARVVQRRFYDGLTFHRVIANFMIQGGSPNGQGTDGPGYQFEDEFHPELLHSSEGTLSMANSGPDSNGSQFFVTVTNTPWLDNKHSVFGRVVEGMDVVHQLSKAPTGPNDAPVTPIVLQEIRILRIGEAAVAFNPGTLNPPLPAVGSATIGLQRQGDDIHVLLQPPAGVITHLFVSDNFEDWNYASTLTPPPSISIRNLLGQPASAFPHVFFRCLYGERGR
jgi:peptidyl-prolyl cis-trans isomerase A (cyclophilin A)